MLYSLLYYMLYHKSTQSRSKWSLGPIDHHQTVLHGSAAVECANVTQSASTSLGLGCSSSACDLTTDDCVWAVDDRDGLIRSKGITRLIAVLAPPGLSAGTIFVVVCGLNVTKDRRVLAAEVRAFLAVVVLAVNPYDVGRLS